MGVSNKKYRRAKRIIKPHPYRVITKEKIPSWDIRHFAKNMQNWGDTHFDNTPNVDVPDIPNYKFLNLQTLAEFLINTGQGLTINQQNLKILFSGALKNKNIPMILFRNGDHQMFDILIVGNEAIKRLINDKDFSPYIYAFRLNGKEHFFRKRIKAYTQ